MLNISLSFLPEFFRQLDFHFYPFIPHLKLVHIPKSNSSRTVPWWVSIEGPAPPKAAVDPARDVEWAVRGQIERDASITRNMGRVRGRDTSFFYDREC